MEVKSGAEWTNPDTGAKRLLEITVDGRDGEQQWPVLWTVKGEGELSVVAKLKRLQKLADMYVVQSMMKEGALSQEYGQARLKAIQEA